MLQKFFQLLAKFKKWGLIPNEAARAHSAFVLHSGFTLIEVAVVAAMIALLSMVMIFNFRSSSTNITARNQTVAGIVSDIRRAQSLSTNSTIYRDSVGVLHTVCGYGIQYSGLNTNYATFDPNNTAATGNSYIIYGKLKPGIGESASCSTISTRNYVHGSDFIVQKIILANSNMDIKSSCVQGAERTFNNTDIFFEPPDPKTYINNTSSLAAQSVDIMIKVKPNSNCNSPSAVIQVNTSGSIDVNTY